MITNRLKKKFKRGQLWTIGQKTRQLVKENHNIEIGDTVEVIETIGRGGFYLVKCIKTGIQFDVTGQSLGKLVE